MVSWPRLPMPEPLAAASLGRHSLWDVSMHFANSSRMGSKCVLQTTLGEANAAQ